MTFTVTLIVCFDNFSELPEWNAKRYMEEQRNQRENEFAPPQFYYDNQHTAPRTSSNINNPAKCTSSSLAAASVGSNTDAMPKDAENSGGGLLQASESVGRIPIKSDLRQNDGYNTESVGKFEASINLAAIPMPDDRQESGDVHALLSASAQKRGEADSPAKCGQDRASGTDGKEFHYQDKPFQSTGQEYVQSQDHFQPVSFFGPVPDVSVPPPVWYSQSQALPQQSSGDAAPSRQPSASATSRLAGSSIYQKQCHASMTPFVYPSQQGLLNTQLQQSPSTLQEKVIPSTVLSTASKTTVTMPTIPKLNVVDKRFMQNREVSDEDLLGYMVNASTDPLVRVEPVSYIPGTFSCAADASQRQVTTSDPYTSSTGPHTEEGDMDTQGQQGTNRAKPSTAETEGVIFGVPDFLLPASDITAKTYQPGSFMAAKEAAAQKAEEVYEIARKKKEYSSAPVLYK